MAESKAPEMTGKERIDFENGRHSSLVFLRHNPDYILNKRNALLMKEELTKRNLAWTTENLQTVWDSVDKTMFDTEDTRPAAKELPAPVEALLPEPKQFPWGTKLEGREGAARVAAMSNADFAKYLKDRRTGPIFQAQVDALRMTRSQLRKGDL
jgi:hypothetical protein